MNFKDAQLYFGRSHGQCRAAKTLHVYHSCLFCLRVTQSLSGLPLSPFTYCFMERSERAKS